MSRNKQIKQILEKRMEDAKTWTPERALEYLIGLGIYNEDGNLTEEYGGTKKCMYQELQELLLDSDAFCIEISDQDAFEEVVTILTTEILEHFDLTPKKQN